LQSEKENEEQGRGAKPDVQEAGVVEGHGHGRDMGGSPVQGGVQSAATVASKIGDVGKR